MATAAQPLTRPKAVAATKIAVMRFTSFFKPMLDFLSLRPTGFVRFWANFLDRRPALISLRQQYPQTARSIAGEMCSNIFIACFAALAVPAPAFPFIAKAP
jgi:hypothetical protein